VVGKQTRVIGFERVQDRIREVTECIRRAGLPLGCTASKPRSVEEYRFTENPAEYKIYWDVRKGLIPIVGAAREPGASPQAAPLYA
jgi:D-lactate dehydrogenase